MKGSCLCGKVAFSLSTLPMAFYRCHCSLCRKQTGVGFNQATLVRRDNFSWVEGADNIKSWSKSGGYRTDFCTDCGSTVPNVLRDLPYVWVPLGLLDEELDLRCIADYCIDDARCWDLMRSDSSHGGAVKSLSSLLQLLGVEG